jgi:hypothetical protein
MNYVPRTLHSNVRGEEMKKKKMTMEEEDKKENGKTEARRRRRKGKENSRFCLRNHRNNRQHEGCGCDELCHLPTRTRKSASPVGIMLGKENVWTQPGVFTPPISFTSRRLLNFAVLC